MAVVLELACCLDHFHDLSQGPNGVVPVDLKHDLKFTIKFFPLSACHCLMGQALMICMHAYMHMHVIYRFMLVTYMHAASACIDRRGAATLHRAGTAMTISNSFQK